MKNLFLILISVIVFDCDIFHDSPSYNFGISESGNTQKNNESISIDSIRFIASGNCKYNVSGKKIEIIRDADSYKKILSELGIERESELKEIDFKNEIIMTIIDGQKPSSGYKLRFENVEDSPEALFITIGLLLPGTNCNVDFGFTSPYLIGAIPKTNKDIKCIFTEKPNISAEVLYTGNCANCKNTENTIEIINDEVTYNELLRNIEVINTTNLKSVDFINETVIYVVMGPKPSSGFNLSLKDVGECYEQDEDYLEVDLAIPGSNCAVDAGITRPFLFVAVPKMQKKVRLIIRESIFDCRR